MEQPSGSTHSTVATTVTSAAPTVVSSVLIPANPQEDANISVTSAALSEGQRSLSGAPSASSSPILSPPGKIFGRNANGTMVATSRPSNEAEVQLYRVLQRASLLAYYDTLLEMGGDDVQQLYEAGEEEFLEIMALVGMASKPLHVRRLQKVLHEWANNQALFQSTLPSVGFAEAPLPTYIPEPSTSRPKFTISPGFNPTPLMSTVPTSSQIVPNITPTPVVSLVGNITPTHTGLSSQVTSSSPQLTPILTSSQVERIALVAAEIITRELPRGEPRGEPRAQTSKKRTSRELEQVIAMSENDPRRMEEIRKYSAIYGRFDCKRRPEKPLTLHEVCVNEAAAQLCKLIPVLLTRRDQLFPLARSVVKEAGFGHSANIARCALGQPVQRTDESSQSESSVKRMRLSSTDNITNPEFKDSLEDSRYNLFTMYQKFAKPPFDLSDIAKFSLTKSDFEDNENEDSRYSFSNSSTPPLPMNDREFFDSGRDDTIKSPHKSTDSIATSPLGVQVIAASGGHIIAVANPALAMSPALNEAMNNIKREADSPEI
ncbi:NGFI-A-binding protein homolog [Eupeodes corollae]|uniref:NGFI-A-binding protein homolog n=1 Tax=Eupeodes corollae TaxID=290404 RepID=UPI00248F4877|nr:NGFI-A-binding protein homolog [Eupeodes corollae]